MNGFKPTKAQHRIMELESCIRNFKVYDKKRMTYLRGLEKENEELKGQKVRLNLQIDRLGEQINILIDTYDKADVMKDGSDRRNYVKGLLDRIMDGTPRISKRQLEMIDTVLSKEVLSLRKGMTTMANRIKDLEKENEKLKRK